MSLLLVSPFKGSVPLNTLQIKNNNISSLNVETKIQSITVLVGEQPIGQTIPEA